VRNRDREAAQRSRSSGGRGVQWTADRASASSIGQGKGRDVVRVKRSALVGDALSSTRVNLAADPSKHLKGGSAAGVPDLLRERRLKSQATAVQPCRARRHAADGATPLARAATTGQTSGWVRDARDERNTRSTGRVELPPDGP